MIITNNTNIQNFNLKMRPQQTCRIPFRGNALPKGAVVDIKANGKYPANILSNFAKTGFEIDGVIFKNPEEKKLQELLTKKNFILEELNNLK